MNKSEQDYISLCKRQIEEKLRLERHAGTVKQRDLEYLADVIEEKSGITLSLSTLKRLWKNDYDQTPHPSTLQALVSVLNIKDWQEFKLQQQPGVPSLALTGKPAPGRRFSKWLAIPVAAGFALVVFLAVTFNSHPPAGKPVVTGPVTFFANKTVTQGVPNTVIFNYNVPNVRADSFFIQQSWNPLDKAPIDPAGNYLSSMYYYPGFHRAKLIANDSVIASLRIHITTDGWLPLVRYTQTEKVPVYLQKTNIVSDGRLQINLGNLKASNVNTAREFMLSCFNVRDFGNINSDSMEVETRVKCDSISNIACPGFQLIIMCEENIFFVRLMAKGCARNIAVQLGEVYRDGINSDLSALGCDLYQWQDLKVKIANKQAKVFLNDKLVYSTTFRNEFGKVVGLNYNFTGAGSIDYARLGNADSRWVYADEFD